MDYSFPLELYTNFSVLNQLYFPCITLKTIFLSHFKIIVPLILSEAWKSSLQFENTFRLNILYTLILFISYCFVGTSICCFLFSLFHGMKLFFNLVYCNYGAAEEKKSSLNNVLSFVWRNNLLVLSLMFHSIDCCDLWATEAQILWHIWTQFLTLNLLHFLVPLFTRANTNNCVQFLYRHFGTEHIQMNVRMFRDIQLFYFFVWSVQFELRKNDFVRKKNYSGILIALKATRK